MKILVLSRRGTLYSTRRFTKASLQLGHHVMVLDPLRCVVVVAKDAGAIYVKDKPLETPDVVLPRIGASITDYGLATVSQLELIGLPVVNSSQAIVASRDKLRCLQILAMNGVAIPRTIMCRDARNLDRILELVGGTPVIVKLIQGAQGVGVMMADSRGSLEGLLDTVWNLGREVLIQEYVPESKGEDLRVLVVGGEVIGVIRRIARPGEFRSNIHKGGEAKAVDVPQSYRDLAVAAARALALNIAGVDIIESNSGPKVMEVNSSPGFEGLERATGQDVARKIIEYTVQYAEKAKERKKAA